MQTIKTHSGPITLLKLTGRNVMTLVTYPLGQNLYFYFPPEGEFYVSNIIVAVNSKLDVTSPEIQSSTPLLRSQIYPVRLPLSAPTDDSTFVADADGKYVGTASGQKLVQTIDTSELITKYGGTTKVSHLGVLGNPGYYVGYGITTASGITEANGTVTAHGSCALSQSPNANPNVVWQTASGATLADIDGLKIGWQVFVHVDPGYGRLMELHSNTELEYVENSTYNPTSGVAFTCTSGSRSF